MAVYRRIYRPYSGRFTNESFRFLVLTRYGLKTLFDSRPLFGRRIIVTRAREQAGDLA